MTKTYSSQNITRHNASKILNIVSTCYKTWWEELEIGFLPLDLIVKTLFMSDVIFSNISPEAATGFPLQVSSPDQMATDYSAANSSEEKPGIKQSQRQIAIT